jgi:hypothetical protein
VAVLIFRDSTRPRCEPVIPYVLPAHSISYERCSILHIIKQCFWPPAVMPGFGYSGISGDRSIWKMTRTRKVLKGLNENLGRPVKEPVASCGHEMRQSTPHRTCLNTSRGFWRGIDSFWFVYQGSTDCIISSSECLCPRDSILVTSLLYALGHVA